LNQARISWDIDGHATVPEEMGLEKSLAQLIVRQRICSDLKRSAW
jgi:hypothetical protein